MESAATTGPAPLQDGKLASDQEALEAFELARQKIELQQIISWTLLFENLVKSLWTNEDNLFF